MWVGILHSVEGRKRISRFSRVEEILQDSSIEIVPEFPAFQLALQISDSRMQYHSPDFPASKSALLADKIRDLSASTIA